MENYKKLHIVISDELSYKMKDSLDDIVYTLKNERELCEKTFILRHGRPVNEAIKFLFSEEK